MRFARTPQKGAHANEIRQRAYNDIREDLSKVVPGAAGSGDSGVSEATQTEAPSQQVGHRSSGKRREETFYYEFHELPLSI